MSVQFVEFYHSHLSLSLLSPCSKKREIEASKVIFCRPKSGTLLALYSYDSKVVSLKHFTLPGLFCDSTYYHRDLLIRHIECCLCYNL